MWITRYFKRCRIEYIRVAFICTVFAAFFLPVIRPVESVGDNIFSLEINGNKMGDVDSPEDADRLLMEARRAVASENESILLLETDTKVVGREVIVGEADPDEMILTNIENEYRNSVKETLHHSYTIKIGEYMVNVATEDDVMAILQASVGKYDTEGKFEIKLAKDPNRELPVIVPFVNRKVVVEDDGIRYPEDYLKEAGFFSAFREVYDSVELEVEPDFDDFEYGVTDVKFADSVEIVESYLPRSEIKSVEAAIEEVTKDKEQKTIYEVVSGDTLSGISNKVGISVEELIALNDTLENERSLIRIGDELTITVPKPELGVRWQQLFYYEGTYEADVIYVYNDDWYTTQEVTLQDPSSGYHKAVQRITYLNNEIESTDTVKEEIIAEAIPKIVEKGTKIPPTFIKPISGGRLTSGFSVSYGYRKATVAGMTSNHLGVDWGTPVGTTVVASSGGTVIQAGWVSGYGYAVYIQHPAGVVTRYAHLSRVLVSKGQYVSQGQKIAYSGNTGASTGPHLHFEIRINGSAVNPLNYLN